MKRSRMLAIAVVLMSPGCATEKSRGVDATVHTQVLAAQPPVEHLEGLAREPMIVETTGGTLFVTGYGEEKPMLWRSDDGGATWRAVNIGTENDGAIGNSDVDLALAPDGTLYFIVMSFDRQKSEGTGIAIASSTDGGVTWRWTQLSQTRFDDRPWVEVGPDNVAHVIWNDGAGVNHALSRDRGATWTRRPRIDSVGGSSHLAIGPTGGIAVRITPLSASGHKLDEGVDRIAVSTDGGESWSMRDLPGTRAWTRSFDPADGVQRWVEPVAWDSAGALYALSSEGVTLWLARSTDDGASWTRWPVVDDSTALYFPYLVARGDGELAATWHSGTGDSLRANVAYIRVDDRADAPRVTRTDPIDVAAWRRGEGDAPATRDPGGEYVPVVFLRDGRIAVVSPIQDPARDRWGFTFRPYALREGG